MLVVGLILIVIAAVLLVAALAGGLNDPATFELGILRLDTDTLGVFLLGAATVLIFVMGLELVRSGVRRANRRRKEKKELNRLSERGGASSRDEAAPERQGTRSTNGRGEQSTDRARGTDPE